MGNSLLWSALVLVVAYLLGSMPTGYWLGRLLKGIDIREHGSKSIGATNVLRTLGKGPALTVLLIDILKGVAAIAFSRWLFSLPTATTMPGLSATDWGYWMDVLAGLTAIVGHSKSFWIGFKGGKSVATGLGVMLTLSWQVGLGAIAVFALVLATSRIVSLGSILAAIAVPILMLVFQRPFPYLLLAIAAAAYILTTHRANIQRLLAGTEPKVGQKHEVNAKS